MPAARKNVPRRPAAALAQPTKLGQRGAMGRPAEKPQREAVKTRAKLDPVKNPKESSARMDDPITTNDADTARDNRLEKELRVHAASREVGQHTQELTATEDDVEEADVADNLDAAEAGKLDGKDQA